MPFQSGWSERRRGKAKTASVARTTYRERPDARVPIVTRHLLVCVGGFCPKGSEVGPRKSVTRSQVGTGLRPTRGVPWLPAGDDWLAGLDDWKLPMRGLLQAGRGRIAEPESSPWVVGSAQATRSSICVPIWPPSRYVAAWRRAATDFSPPPQPNVQRRATEPTGGRPGSSHPIAGSVAVQPLVPCRELGQI